MSWDPFFETADLFESLLSGRGVEICLLYTSDAADERSSVDLGGRRIIKKKNQVVTRGSALVISKHRDVSTYADVSQAMCSIT